jgi:hypothetical protein
MPQIIVLSHVVLELLFNKKIGKKRKKKIIYYYEKPYIFLLNFKCFIY